MHVLPPDPYKQVVNRAFEMCRKTVCPSEDMDEADRSSALVETAKIDVSKQLETLLSTATPASVDALRLEYLRRYIEVVVSASRLLGMVAKEARGAVPGV